MYHPMRITAAMLGVLVALAPRADAVTPHTAPDGDFDRNGEVTVTDLQCLVVLFNVYALGAAMDECATDADCGLAMVCRDAWDDLLRCVPDCIAEDVALQPTDGLCIDPAANDAQCVGVVERNLTDLNCDHAISNVDLQFMSWILLNGAGGPDSPDVDGDGLLNFCDDDSDGDGVPDEQDCGVLEATVYPDAPEHCDSLDNDCDGLTDALDDDLVLAPCDLTLGVCEGAIRTVDLCVGGQWGACTVAHYPPTFDPDGEQTCDGLDNDCDGAADHLDEDTAGLSCCGEPADCDPSFASAPVCSSPDTCQGSRVDAVCNDNECGSEVTDDDSACDTSTHADDCGPYPDQLCTGEPDQVAPVCPSTCPCDPDAFCNALDACLPNSEKLQDGALCTLDVECVSDNCGGAGVGPGHPAVCCAEGDCCTTIDDCPEGYELPPQCFDPETCSGWREDKTCIANVCGSLVVPDDSACDDGDVIDTCGPYPTVTCNSAIDQTVPSCATFCDGSLDCDDDAWCHDNACLPDQADGSECETSDECISGHCGPPVGELGYCCAAGDCCVTAADCPTGTWNTAPVCASTETCQGSRGVAACVANQCTTVDTEDDSGCGVDIEAFECGLLEPVFCDGTADQQPACPGGCAVDDDCIDGFHCDGGECLPNVPNGGKCDENGDCKSGYCSHDPLATQGYCCNGGECCALSGHCPSHTGTSVCHTPAACQGSAQIAICSSNSCGSFPVADDKDCGIDTIANDCGMKADALCTGEKSQISPGCLPGPCATHDQCDPDAWCDAGTCVPRVEDGQPCGQDGTCLSDHCQNGYCCQTGDCCVVEADCPLLYTSAPGCATPEQCQGFGTDVACQSNVCAAVPYDDDSGCAAGELGDSCGPYPSQLCAGGTEQGPPAACASSCATDADCDEAAFCTGGECTFKHDDGDACSDDNECLSGYCGAVGGGGLTICCGGGDCCTELADCSGSYASPAQCTSPETCQGIRGDAGCVDHQCQTVPADDDSACAAGSVADDCQSFADETCPGGSDQPVAACPDGCEDDTVCDPGAHCLEGFEPGDPGACLPDLVDGEECDEASDCVSAYCSQAAAEPGGYCCAAGDCCDVAASCDGYAVPATCDDAVTCQGVRMNATCESNQCGAELVQDDSGCHDAVQSKDCGLQAPALCNGTADQTEPQCVSGCTTDADCADAAHCEGTECKPDLPDGLACTGDAQCASKHCSGGLCCATGDCCIEPGDCPAEYTVGSTCDEPATCQGQRSVPTCTLNVCGALEEPDDSGCAGQVAKDCGLFAPVLCTADLAQTDVGDCQTDCTADSDCDDLVYCNGPEACVGGQCANTQALDTSDGIDCTADSCDEAADQIVHAPLHSECADGNPCNGDEQCVAAVGCQPGTPLPTTDLVACTVDTCDPETGESIHTPSDEFCSNGLFCDGAEVCNPTAGCQPGDPPEVDDLLACTTDICNEFADEVQHTPVDSACADGIFCTQDLCTTSFGCLNSLLPGFCLVEGVCFLTGATNLTNECQLCDPVKSQIDWTPKTPDPEVCNGVDDDCDGTTDENESDEPLAQACENACLQPGTETCLQGSFVGCTAPAIQELCEDTIDNDCDTVVDESDCFVPKPAVDDAVVVATTSLGRPTQVSEALGDGRYAVDVTDLANPNRSGEVSVSAFGEQSGTLPFTTVALPPALLEVVVARPTLYADQRETQLFVQVKDSFDRPPAIGTQVSAQVTGLPGGTLGGLGCQTDATGRCEIPIELPEEAFDSAGSLTVAVFTGSLPALARMIDTVARPPALAISAPGCGLQLPQHAVFPSEWFTVDVMANTAGATLGSYDFTVYFAKNQIEVLALEPGSCAAFGTPTSNVGTANSIGALSFNAAASSGGEPCATGTAVHVATITMRPLFTLDPDSGQVATVSAVAVGLFDTTLGTIAQNATCQIADATGQSAQGGVATTAASVMGILARASDAQLLHLQPLTGTNQSVLMTVTGVKKDFSTVSLSTHPQTSYASSDSQIAPVLAGGSISAGPKAGSAVVTAIWNGFSSSTRARILTPMVAPGELDLTLTDTQLNAINGTGGMMQTSRLRAIVDWTDGVETVFREDVTDLLTIDPGTFVAYDATTHTLSGSTPGVVLVTAKGAFGNQVGARALQIVPSTVVDCDALRLVPACEILLESLEPDEPTVALGRTRATATVNAFMNTYQQTCQLQVFAQTSDGAELQLTGHPDIVITTTDDTVFHTTATGLMTAISDGEATAEAEWSVSGQPLCAGSTVVKVKLPKAVDILATPLVAQIAIDDQDPAATVQGFPASQQLKIDVLFEDGSTIDFTTHPTTSYDAVTLDPDDLVTVTADGVVSATGSGTGEAKLRVAVAQYPVLDPVQPTVIVVQATSMTVDVYEPFTPALPRVEDHMLQLIEDTSTRQDGTWTAALHYSDGSTSDVTQHPDTVASIVEPGTTTAAPGVVTLSVNPATVTAQAAGTVDLRVVHGAFEARVEDLMVTDGRIGIAALFPSLPDGGDTLSGIKDQTQVQLETISLMLDGTRRRVYAGRAIPGLLTYGSTTGAATVDSNGLAVAHANGPAVLQVDIAAAVDMAPALDPPAELSVAVNLTPDVGDIDVGDTSGLAFKPRSPGEVFTLEVRASSGDLALGAFDVEISYPIARLTALSVVRGADVQDAVFSGNVAGAPGKVLFNGTIPINAAPRKGPALRLAVITFEAASSGPTAIGGTVLEIVGLNEAQPIGPPTPRPLVAGDGSFTIEP